MVQLAETNEACFINSILGNFEGIQWDQGYLGELFRYIRAETARQMPETQAPGIVGAHPHAYAHLAPDEMIRLSVHESIRRAKRADTGERQEAGGVAADGQHTVRDESSVLSAEAPAQPPTGPNIASPTAADALAVGDAAMHAGPGSGAAQDGASDLMAYQSRSELVRWRRARCVQ